MERGASWEMRCVKPTHWTDDLSLPDRLRAAVGAPVAPGKLSASSRPAINLLSTRDALEINKMHLFESIPGIKQPLGFFVRSLIGAVILCSHWDLGHRKFKTKWARSVTPGCAQSCKCCLALESLGSSWANRREGDVLSVSFSPPEMPFLLPLGAQSQPILKCQLKRHFDFSRCLPPLIFTPSST